MIYRAMICSTCIDDKQIKAAILTITGDWRAQYIQDMAANNVANKWRANVLKNFIGESGFRFRSSALVCGEDKYIISSISVGQHSSTQPRIGKHSRVSCKYSSMILSLEREVANTTLTYCLSGL